MNELGVGSGMGGVNGVDGDSDGGSRSRRNLKPILWFDELRRSALLLKLSSTCSRMQEVSEIGKKEKMWANVPSFLRASVKAQGYRQQRGRPFPRETVSSHIIYPTTLFSDVH